MTGSLAGAGPGGLEPTDVRSAADHLVAKGGHDRGRRSVVGSPVGGSVLSARFAPIDAGLLRSGEHMVPEGRDRREHRVDDRDDGLVGGIVEDIQILRLVVKCQVEGEIAQLAARDAAARDRQDGPRSRDVPLSPA